MALTEQTVLVFPKNTLLKVEMIALICLMMGRVIGGTILVDDWLVLDSL